jgi:hypothetical protein
MILYYNIKTGNSYPSRFDALKDSKNSFYYFRDKEFLATDWTNEPSESLSELYRKRAEEIRAEYEYVIIAYSGGHDSTNVLETFYYNNIHIDEILVVGALSQDPNSESDDNHNGDLYYNVFPTLNKLKLPNTKITVVDYTKYFDDLNNFTMLKKYGSEYLEHIGSYYSVHHLFWADLKKFIGQDNDKKTAVVFGADKPIICYDEDLKKYYTIFTDTEHIDYGNFQLVENFHRVKFYADADVKLRKKQLHVLKRFLTLTNYIIKDYNVFVCKLIYNLKHPLIFASVKAKSNVLSQRDLYLIKNRTSDVYKIFKEGIKSLITKYPHIINPDFRNPQKLKSRLSSRRYYL